MILLGLKFFGKSQKTADGYYICTKFFHISFFPLIPVQSFIVLKKTSAGIIGKPVPMNRLSLVAAYGRGISIASIFLVGVMAFLAYSERHSPNPLVETTPLLSALASLWALTCAAVLVISYLHPRLTRASQATERWVEEQLKELQRDKG